MGRCQQFDVGDRPPARVWLALLDFPVENARGETDTEKRRAIVQDIQRYLGQKMYGIRWPGGSTGFALAWPALANFNVFIGDQRQLDYNWWIDETKAPLKKA